MLCDYTWHNTEESRHMYMCLGITCFGCVTVSFVFLDMASVYQQAAVYQFLQDEDVHITRYTSDDVWCSAWTFQPLVSH